MGGRLVKKDKDVRKREEQALREQKIPPSNDRHSVIIGYVVIPSDVDRQEYVESALRTHTVCVRTNQGEFIKNCPVAYSFVGANDGILHSLEFPEDTNKLGSQVVCLNVPDSDIPIVIGCLAKNRSGTNLDEEGQFKIFRSSDNGSYIIEGRAIEGILSMLVTGKEQGGAKISISTSSLVKTGEITLSTDTMSIHTTKAFNLLSNEIIEFLARNLKQDDKLWASLKMELLKITLNAQRINLGTDADQAVMKGDDTVAELNKMNVRINTIFDAIENAVPVLQDGGTALQATMKVILATAKNEEDFSNVLSEKSFTE